MEKEVKNQNEVRAIEYVSYNVPVGDKHMCFESRVFEDERVGDRENVREICTILNKGAELLEGEEAAELFCDFVKRYCNEGENSLFVWDGGMSVSTWGIDRITTYLNDVLYKLDKGNTKSQKVIKQMLRELYVYMEKLQH